MVMYEIWSLGHKPFGEFTIEEVCMYNVHVRISILYYMYKNSTHMHVMTIYKRHKKLPMHC